MVMTAVDTDHYRDGTAFSLHPGMGGWHSADLYQQTSDTQGITLQYKGYLVFVSGTNQVAALAWQWELAARTVSERTRQSPAAAIYGRVPRPVYPGHLHL